MDKSNFFYCYNPKLFKYLHEEKSLSFITIAKNPTTNKTFSIFCKSDSLQNALDEYKVLQK